MTFGPNGCAALHMYQAFCRGSHSNHSSSLSSAPTPEQTHSLLCPAGNIGIFPCGTVTWRHLCKFQIPKLPRTGPRVQLKCRELRSAHKGIGLGGLKAGILLIVAPVRACRTRTLSSRCACQLVLQREAFVQDERPVSGSSPVSAAPLSSSETAGRG
ncbi:uncharacterized protein BJX67DRAFT_347264 [Aspergillus lucknowensis]|uniref:Uncharacterized protein n=1 Tax=Aspergillus lucknowensis TaxID=176173 RepID=A0ABR4LZF1_9EURO